MQDGVIPDGYKLTEVGVIPCDWEVKRLGEVSVKIQDGTHFSPKSKQGNYRYITSKNIRNGYLDLQECEWISHEEHKKIYARCNVKFGDILLTKDGVNTGNAAFNNLYEQFSLLSSVALIRTDENYLTPIFLLQYILSSIGHHQLIEMMTGLAITRLTLSKIKLFKIPLPPLPEQKRIAKALSNIDELITALDKLITKKRYLKQGAMQQLLTGKTRLPGFTGAWEVRRLGEVGSFKNGINKGKEDFGFGYPFVNLLDVFGKQKLEKAISLGLINSSKNERNEYNLLLGDILFVRSSVKPEGVGLIAVLVDDFTNTVYSGFLIRFRDHGDLDINYKIHCFYDRNFRNSLIDSSTVSANTNINQQALKNLLIPLPPLPEQKAIAQILTKMDEEIEALEKKRDKYKKIKQGMMSVLLTGRIRLM
jgi:type I restriction enzyme S subunit